MVCYIANVLFELHLLMVRFLLFLAFLVLFRLASVPFQPILFVLLLLIHIQDQTSCTQTNAHRHTERETHTDSQTG